MNFRCVNVAVVSAILIQFSLWSFQIAYIKHACCRTDMSQSRRVSADGSWRPWSQKSEWLGSTWNPIKLGAEWYQIITHTKWLLWFGPELLSFAVPNAWWTGPTTSMWHPLVYQQLQKCNGNEIVSSNRPDTAGQMDEMLSRTRNVLQEKLEKFTYQQC